MKKQCFRLMFVAFAAAGLYSESPAHAGDRDTAEIRTAVASFYTALNVMFTGDLEPMKRGWSHKKDVTYMGPDGSFHVGWKQVSAEWEKQAALKLGGKVEPKGMRITVGRDLGIVSNYEVGKNVAGGKAINVNIRVTSMFRKENGHWKMIGDHTDILPFLQK